VPAGSDPSAAVLLTAHVAWPGLTQASWAGLSPPDPSTTAVRSIRRCRRPPHELGVGGAGASPVRESRRRRAVLLNEVLGDQLHELRLATEKLRRLLTEREKGGRAKTSSAPKQEEQRRHRGAYRAMGGWRLALGAVTKGDVERSSGAVHQALCRRGGADRRWPQRFWVRPVEATTPARLRPAAVCFGNGGTADALAFKAAARGRPTR
jgi:hypothetical protein